MDGLTKRTPNDTAVSVPAYTNIADGYRAALQVVDDVILKNYISELSRLDIVPLSKGVLQSNIRDNVRFFKITEVVYEKDELATYKFASVFHALSMTDSAVFILIDSDGVKTDFYMGVRSLDEYRTVSSLKNTVENALKGQFPGIKTFDDCTVDDMENILNRVKAKNISAVSCVANQKEQEHVTNQSFVQGLEKLVLSMQGEKYTGIIIANGTSQAQLRELRKGYEMIYTQLSAFAATQVNYINNSSVSQSVAQTQGSSHARSQTDHRSQTNSESATTGSSTSHSTSKESVAGKAIKGLSFAASVVGAALAPVTGGLSLAVGGVVAGGLGMVGSGIGNSISDSTSSQQSTSRSVSSVSGFSEGMTNTVNYGISKTQGHTTGFSEGMTLTLHDKSIENMLERIDRQLQRMDEFESLGMYECAAYFLSDNPYAAEAAASTYKALMRGENSGVEIAAINSWGQFQSEKTARIAEYVKNFMHPVFKYHGSAGIWR